MGIQAKYIPLTTLFQHHTGKALATAIRQEKEMKGIQTGGNSLVGQWLGLHASTARGPGLIPGWGTKILQAVWCGQKKKYTDYKGRNKTVCR